MNTKTVVLSTKRLSELLYILENRVEESLSIRIKISLLMKI